MRPMPAGKHKCAVDTCGTPVETKYLMCARHWAQVPDHIQRNVYFHYFDGRAKSTHPTDRYLTAIDQAKAAVHAKAATQAVERDNQREARRG